MDLAHANSFRQTSAFVYNSAKLLFSSSAIKSTKFISPPGCRRSANGALELAGKMIDVAKSTDICDFGKRYRTVCYERLRVRQPFPQQPLMRAGAQMLLEQAPDVRRTELC